MRLPTVIAYLLATVLVLAFADLASASGTVDWPQYGFDAGHSGYNPAENTITINNVNTLQLIWKVSVGTNNRAGDVVEANGMIYSASANGMLYGLDAGTGAQAWVFASGNRYRSSGTAPTVDSGLVVTVCDLSQGVQGLCALDALDGSLVWTYAVPGSLSYVQTPPVVAAGAIFFEGCGSACAYIALDEQTGEVLWSRASSPESGCNAANNGVTPAISGGRLFVGWTCPGSYDYAVAALRIKSGAQRWADGSSSRNAGLAVAKGLAVAVLASASSESLVGIAAKNGAVRWTSEQFATSAVSMPAIADKIVVVTEQNKVKGLSSQYGSIRWESSDTHSNSAPSVANGVVFTACSVHPCAYSLNDGSLFWFDAGTASYGVPIVVNGTLFGACSGSNVCAWALPGSRHFARAARLEIPFADVPEVLTKDKTNGAGRPAWPRFQADPLQQRLDLWEAYWKRNR